MIEVSPVHLHGKGEHRRSQEAKQEVARAEVDGTPVGGVCRTEYHHDGDGHGNDAAHDADGHDNGGDGGDDAHNNGGGSKGNLSGGDIGNSEVVMMAGSYPVPLEFKASFFENVHPMGLFPFGCQRSVIGWGTEILYYNQVNQGRSLIKIRRYRYHGTYRTLIMVWEWRWYGKGIGYGHGMVMVTVVTVRVW